MPFINAQLRCPAESKTVQHFCYFNYRKIVAWYWQGKFIDVDNGHMYEPNVIRWFEPETSFESLMKDHAEWTAATFPAATSISSIMKAKDEIHELIEALGYVLDWDGFIPHKFPDHVVDQKSLLIEYVDCVKCLFDSMARAGFTPEQFRDAFAEKLAINKARKWQDKGDGTYSHIKDPLPPGKTVGEFLSEQMNKNNNDGNNKAGC